MPPIGAMAFTPDGNCMLGPAPELENCFVAVGFNAFGIAAGGGEAGTAVADQQRLTAVGAIEADLAVANLDPGDAVGTRRQGGDQGVPQDVRRGARTDRVGGREQS